MKSYVILVLVASATSLESAFVRHIDFRGSHLIDINSSSYAITGPVLENNARKSVSLKPDGALVIDSLCNQELMLNLTEFDKVRDYLLAVTALNPQSDDGFASTTYRLGGDPNEAGNSTGSLNYQLVLYDEFAIQMRDKAHYSFASRDPNAGYDRIFVLYDTVTIVSKRGLVTMKPRACLDQSEERIVKRSGDYVTGYALLKPLSLDDPI